MKPQQVIDEDETGTDRLVEDPPPEPWPEPEGLIAKIEPEEYPLDALPALIRRAVEEVQAFTKAPIPLVASSALGVVSLAGQAHVDVKRVEKLQGPTALFMLTIADSGERKTTVDGMFLSAVRAYEEEQRDKGKEEMKTYTGELKAWESERDGILAAIKQASKTNKPIGDLKLQLTELQHYEPKAPKIPSFLRVDDTPESLAWDLATKWPSGGVISSEAGTVFGAHGMQKDSIVRNLARLNVYWDGGDLPVNRRTSECFTVHGARLTMALQVQEATIREFFDRSNGLARGTGFLARFLLCWPTSTQGFRAFSEPPAKWPALSAFHRRIADLLPITLNEDGGLTLTVMVFGAPAKRAWINFYDEIEKELADGRELFDVRDVASKTADNAARMAALFEKFKSGNGSISLDCMEGASRIVAWHLSESRRFLSEIALPEPLANAQRRDAWLLGYCRREKTESVPRRQVQQFAPNKLRDRKALDDALEELSELGRVRVRLDGKKKFIEVNPALLAREV